jgi:hypothetical protein
MLDKLQDLSESWISPFRLTHYFVMSSRNQDHLQAASQDAFTPSEQGASRRLQHACAGLKSREEGILLHIQDERKVQWSCRTLNTVP